MRTGLMGQAFLRRDHQVIWWSGTFNHVTRRQDYLKDTQVELQPRWTAFFLRGRSYRKNLSVARIRNHREMARRFRAQALRLERPDLIVCSYPTIELSDAATRLGRELGVPVVLDLRDMWPDIFSEHFSRRLRPLIRLALAPYYWQGRRAMARATALIGITNEFLEWGLARAGRQRTEWDRAVPLAYSDQPPAAAAVRAAEAFWDERGVSGSDGVFTLVFAGSLGLQLDVHTVIEASRRLAGLGVRHRLVICGTGEREAAYWEQARELPNVIMPGWVNGPQLYVLMRRSHVGLNPLPLRFDFLATVNNKAIEYLSAGLPVVSCPREGALFRLLTEERCGLAYDSGHPEGLVALLRGLVQDREGAAAMSRRATEVYRRRFVAEEVYGELVKHLEELMNQPRSR
jgi:glycosyltransferase involved in cell wall biosynthesis